MTQTATHRKVNFSAGPALLPQEVVEEARDNLLSYSESGIGIMEMSHRGKAFVGVLEQAEADCRELLGIGDEFVVLFVTGGASTQFYQVPMNFLQPGAVANYLDTGSWAAKAIKEAKNFGEVHVACSSKADNYTHIPASADLKPGAVYTHFTSNNTIFGTQFRSEPTGAEGKLVCDASSDMMSRPLDMSQYALIYAGAQKNLGPAGVTLVVARREFIDKGRNDVPAMLQYRTHAENQSCYNTPPCFSIYVMSLVFKWLKAKGGLAGIQQHNERKAAVLYDFLDSTEFYRAPVQKESRSLMNVVFRLPSEELEKKLIAEATAEGFDGLKGHRSVGGLRASIYNAMAIEGVEGLVELMREFEKRSG